MVQSWAGGSHVQQTWSWTSSINPRLRASLGAPCLHEGHIGSSTFSPNWNDIVMLDSFLKPGGQGALVLPCSCMSALSPLAPCSETFGSAAYKVSQYIVALHSIFWPPSIQKCSTPFPPEVDSH